MASLCKPYYNILSTSQKMYAQLCQNIEDEFIKNLVESDIKGYHPESKIYLFYNFKENNSYINIGNSTEIGLNIVELDVKSCKTILKIEISKDKFSKTCKNTKYPYEYLTGFKNYLENDNYGIEKFIFISNIKMPVDFNGLICIRKTYAGVIHVQLFCKEEYIITEDNTISFDIVEFDTNKLAI